MAFGKNKGPLGGHSRGERASAAAPRPMAPPPRPMAPPPRQAAPRPMAPPPRPIAPPPRASRPMTPMSPAFGQPVINVNSGRKGGGLLGTITSAAVGVAGAAIVNKMQENSQAKLQAQQAEQQAKLQAQQAEYEAEMREREAEYKVEIEKQRTRQEEAKLEAIQPTKRYYANCPYCLGVNNGSKECQYCGSSLAYYDEADNDDNDGQENVNQSNNMI